MTTAISWKSNIFFVTWVIYLIYRSFELNILDICHFNATWRNTNYFYRCIVQFSCHYDLIQGVSVSNINSIYIPRSALCLTSYDTLNIRDILATYYLLIGKTKYAIWWRTTVESVLGAKQLDKGNVIPIISPKWGFLCVLYILFLLKIKAKKCNYHLVFDTTPRKHLVCLSFLMSHSFHLSYFKLKHAYVYV